MPAPADPGAFESAALMALVTNLRPRAHWIDGEDRFWMQLETGDGSRFVVVDAATGKQVPAFDHARLAASLAEAGLANAAADNLPITSLGLGGAGIVVTTASGAFNCSRDAAHCARDETPPALARGARLAGRKAHRLCARRQPVGSGTEFGKGNPS